MIISSTINFKMTRVFCFLTAFMFGASMLMASSNKYDEENGEKALQLINHFSTVLYRITDSRDLALLELEYDRISQENIFLDVIEDEEIISIIQQIMDFITMQRLNSGERELLEQWLKKDLRDAIFSTCPNPTGLISSNPKVIATVATQFAFSWFFHYMGERKRLLREFAKQEWELDKENAKKLNERNVRLLEKYWTLIKRYDIKDVERITLPEIAEFVKYADKDQNENRVFEFLKLNEDKYRKFPEYWYRRGRAAQSLGERENAIFAYRQYQKIHLHFLRKDHMAAEVALNLAKLLVDAGNYKKTDMKKQLHIIENNVKADEWSYLYFCGTMYMSLKEYEAAYQVLGKAVKEQEYILASQYNTFIKTLEKEKELDFVDMYQPSSYQLMMCRSAYYQACCHVFETAEVGKRFSQMCEDDMTSGFEMMTYCTPGSHFTKNLPIEIYGLLKNTTAYPDGKIYFHLPMNWFYLGNEVTTITAQMKVKERLRKSISAKLVVYYAEGEPETFTEDVSDRVFHYRKDKKTDKRYFWSEMKFPFKHKIIFKKNVRRIELELPLRGLLVKLVYKPSSSEHQLFPLEENEYSPEEAIINGEKIIIRKDNKQVGTYENIGRSIKGGFQNAR